MLRKRTKMFARPKRLRSWWQMSPRHVLKDEARLRAREALARRASGFLESVHGQTGSRPRW